jgi:predicted heme/steroid binding protein
MRSWANLAAAIAVVSRVLCTEAQEKACSGGPLAAAPRSRLFTVEELSAYKGEAGQQLYLAILGDVFDVSAGSQHYAKGQAYDHFAGTDSSRAFTTGEANGVGRTDDTDNLSMDELGAIADWHRFFATHEVYAPVGAVIGRHYDANGTPTGLFPWKKLEEDKQNAKELKLLLPGCNSKWSQEDGSVVWCTMKSGGVTRDWVGFPRLLTYANGNKKRCACVPQDRVNERVAPAIGGTLEVYEGCDERAERCRVYQK